MKRIIVVGGGISGLTVGALLAMRAPLARGGLSVTVLESAPRPGGKVHSESSDGFLVEWGPNGFLDREPRMRELIAALDLGGRLLPSNDAASRRYIYRAGALRKAPESPPEIFKSDFLPTAAKLRMLLEPLGAMRPDDDTDESVASFARRRIGRGATDVLINAFVLGIYGGDAEQLSLRSAFPRMYDMERNHGSLIAAAVNMRKVKSAAAGPSGKLTSFQGGVSDLTSALAAKLGSNLVCDAPVDSVERVGGGFVVTARGVRYEADAVVLAVPADAAARLVEPLAPVSAAALSQIPIASISVVALGYRREAVRNDLRGFGFLVPRNQGLRIIGSLWSSSIFDHRAPEGHVLIRSMIGGARDPEVVHLPDDVLLDMVEDELRPLVAIEGPRAFQRVIKHERGIPQYTIGHAGRVAAARAAESAHPGLYLTGNSLEGVAMIDCVRASFELVDRILER